jgi:hypothetical protein
VVGDDDDIQPAFRSDLRDFFMVLGSIRVPCVDVDVCGNFGCYKKSSV